MEDVTVPAVLTVEQLAQRWAMPPWSVYDLVRKGKVAALRIGRRVRFRLADIEAYEEKHVQQQQTRGKKTTTHKEH